MLTELGIVAVANAITAIAKAHAQDREFASPELRAARDAFDLALLRGLAGLLHIDLPLAPAKATEVTQ